MEVGMAKQAQGLAVSVLAVTVWPVFVHAQAQAPPPAARQPVMVTQILQRPEMRVIRVAIQPNATRTAHAHADALFHLFMPLDGTIEVTIEGEATERLGPWQPHFFKGGTTHAFTNTSGSVVQWLEVFVQKTASSADIDIGRALAAAMASLSQEPGPRPR
jgi:quercetin dioxygenase-like cupin family protein